MTGVFSGVFLTLESDPLRLHTGAAANEKVLRARISSPMISTHSAGSK